METIKIYRSPSALLRKMVAERRGWFWPEKTSFGLLREDHFRQSEKRPIFAVADGVTLVVKPGYSYPAPSGAGEAAKIFCRSAVEFSEKIYDDFKIKNIQDVFGNANSLVKKYNAKRGRTEKTINYFDVDYFCATAAFALIRNSELFWGAIGDARILLKDKKGRTKLRSGDRVKPIEELTAEKVKNPKPQERKYFQQKYYRNKIGPKGKLIGYGVIDGEREALRYVESGKVKIEKGDQLFIFSDGFTPYFDLPDFKRLFLEWPTGLKKKILAFIREYISKKMSLNPDEQYRFLYKFASEQSLIAIRF